MTSPALSDKTIRRLLRDYIRELRQGLEERGRYVPLAEAFEALWCNVRDDGPADYFYKHPLAGCPFEVFDWQLEVLANEMKVAWPEGSAMG